MYRTEWEANTAQFTCARPCRACIKKQASNVRATWLVAALLVISPAVCIAALLVH